MIRRKVHIALCCLALAACEPSGPQVAAAPHEPDSAAIGFYCRMSLAEHGGPKGQILPKGWSEPLWFTSIRDALTYVEEDVLSERQLAGFWVNDMSQGTWEHPAPGSWIDAREAWYVVGSTRVATMGGREAVPFKTRAGAETFAAAEGGLVVDYQAARRAVADNDHDDDQFPSIETGS